LLDVRSFSLTGSALEHFIELAPHLFDGLSEIGQLASNGRYVCAVCHCCRTLSGERSGSYPR
jgi:hypothetical protein